MKSPLIEFAQNAAELKLPFLLVGGQAAILYGVTRFTRDVDILIAEKQKEPLRDLLSAAGYHLYHQSKAFMQWESSPRDPAGIDIMLVDASTWKKLWDAARPFSLTENIDVHAPSPEHCIALKLHAAKNPHRERSDVDWSDIQALIAHCQIDLQDADFLELVERYGGSEGLEFIERQKENQESP